MPPPITGQLFMRHMGEKDGKPIVAVVGILAFPEDDLPPDEHQLVLSGRSLIGKGGYELHLFKEGAIDRTKEAEGMGLGHLVCEPWWRI